MSKLFKSLTKKGCKACVAAGYGWCPIKLMCGGFANRNCPEDAGDDDADMDDDLEGYASGQRATGLYYNVLETNK